MKINYGNISIVKIEDTFGNILEIKSDGKVWLRLKSGDIKNIGCIILYPNYKVYSKKIDFEKHIFHKTNSVGINNMIISYLSDEDYIEIINKESKEKYTINVRDARGKDEYLNFKEKGYELQYFIPLLYFNKEGKTNGKK